MGRAPGWPAALVALLRGPLPAVLPAAGLLGGCRLSRLGSAVSPPPLISEDELCHSAFGPVGSNAPHQPDDP